MKEEKMSLKDKVKNLKKDIPAVYIALKHKETPIIAKILAAIVVVYALSPVDLIPDFIPVIGFLDDLIILPILIKLVLAAIPKEQFVEYKKEAEETYNINENKKWYFAIPFVIIWLFVIFLIVRLFL
jgi:uncharacterized membrane protein YkvA (DUF1232 family)